ncbi:hypothetical protein [Rhizobium mongolense]|uniref:DUF2798 domain-containing protein n=1 Tax=Rhizobium mongolense TaxID=57676 RepID=A0A7W6RN54_9HYPH|nr:hypothetical protein [Rhizobium mongolense]MBB4274981.1 hypothetical protein [Rhizobium mongolense]
MPYGKRSRRYNTIAVPLILSMLMTGVVSAIVIVATQSVGPLALAVCPMAAVLGRRLPVLLLVMPAVRRIASFIVEL